MSKRKEWRSAIERALKEKGFSKSAARVTANKTILKSIAKRKLIANRKSEVVSNRKYVSAARKIERLHDEAAINQPSTMAGRVVVIPPPRPGAISH